MGNFIIFYVNNDIRLLDWSITFKLYVFLGDCLALHGAKGGINVLPLVW